MWRKMIFLCDDDHWIVYKILLYYKVVLFVKIWWEIVCVQILCYMYFLRAGHLYTGQHENVNFDKICCNLFYVRVNKTDFVMAEREWVLLYKWYLSCTDHTNIFFMRNSWWIKQYKLNKHMRYKVLIKPWINMYLAS